MRDQSDHGIFQRYADGAASADEVDRINARLRTDAAARRDFIELLNLDSALADLSESVEPGTLAAIDTEPDSTGPPSCPVEPLRMARSSGVSGRRKGWAVLAVCAACLIGAFSLVPSDSTEWATIQSRVGATRLHRGDTLRDEPHTIAAGIVQLVTNRGARVVIEAPAAFRFESATRLQMTRGKLSVMAPPSAKGFTVVTPSGEAVDLGTRFGVDVPETGASEIHVFEGEVIATTTDTQTSGNLYGGDAVALQHDARQTRDLRSAAFIDAEEMSELAAGMAAGQQPRSDTAIARLLEDPALIAVLDFESDSEPAGVFRIAQGRWPGSRAPEFVNVGDHMKLDVGGERDWPQLTLAAWARLDRVGEPYQSLLHTDGWGKNNPGQVHWMVNSEATMRFALFGNELLPGSDGPSAFPDSRTAVLPERGRWMHLAVVYDAEAKSVRFYLNGQFDKQAELEVAHAARLGPAQIGNWNDEDRKLSGRIDELVLLGRTMSDQEIRSLHDAGSPYRATPTQ